jgi:hypothetical protein
MGRVVTSRTALEVRAEDDGREAFAKRYRGWEGLAKACLRDLSAVCGAY